MHPADQEHPERSRHFEIVLTYLINQCNKNYQEAKIFFGVPAKKRRMSHILCPMLKLCNLQHNKKNVVHQVK